MTGANYNVIYDLPLRQFDAACPWSLKTVGEMARVLGGGTPDTGVAEFWNPPEFPWATPTDITGSTGNEICSTARCISTEGLRSSTLVPANSILLTSRATIGAAKINRVPMAINQGFAALVPNDGYSTEYLFYLLEMLRPALVRLGAGTTFAEVSRREVRKVRVRVPEQDEQRDIAAALKLADDAIAKARAELEAARALKCSLMDRIFELGLTTGIPQKACKMHRCYIASIPMHWDDDKLGASLQLVEYGTNAPSNDFHSGYPVVAIPQVVSPQLSVSNLTYAKVPDAEANGGSGRRAPQWYGVVFFAQHIQVVRPSLHDASTFIAKGGAVVSLLDLAALGVGELGFQHVGVRTEPLARHRAQHGAEAVGCMPAAEAHAPERSAQRIAVKVRCVLACLRWKHIHSRRCDSRAWMPVFRALVAATARYVRGGFSSWRRERSIRHLRG